MTDLTGNASSFCPLLWTPVERIREVLLIMLWKVLFMSVFRRGVSRNVSFQKFSCISADNRVVSLSPRSTWSVMPTVFLTLKRTCIPGRNPPWSSSLFLLMTRCLLLIKTFLRLLSLYSLDHLVCQYLFLCCLLPPNYSNHTCFLERIWEDSFFLNFTKYPVLSEK